MKTATTLPKLHDVTPPRRQVAPDLRAGRPTKRAHLQGPPGGRPLPSLYPNRRSHSP
jgi:hypothetical protein